MSEYEGLTLAVIGGGLLQCPLIQTAKELGLYVIVVDINPNAPGIGLADDFIISSTLDAETTSENLLLYNNNRKKIDAVITVGTDASYTVALSQKKLNLPGISLESALAATDKYEMRKRFKKHQVPIPDFDIADSFVKTTEIFERLGGDCVIKPVRNMGARGVSRVTSSDDLKEAYELAHSYSHNGKVIIEQYIDSPELSIDALIYNDEIFITGVADRIIEYDPYFVETGHIMPSLLPKEEIDFAIDIFKKGIKALGINIGAAKGDIKISGNACYVGEIAARLSGGFMSTYTYPYSSGVNLMKAVINIALGKHPGDLTPKKNYYSIERAIIPAPGIIKKIEGLDEVKKIKYVNDVFFDAKIGDKIKSPKNNLDKVGHIIVSAPTFSEAIRASHEAINTIKITTVEDEDQLLQEKDILDKARVKFKGKCQVCFDCDGYGCRGKIPGVGSIGNGLGFIEAVRSIRKINILPNYINDVKEVDTTTNFLGKKIDFPIFPAPITGAVTNLGGAITELEYARAIIKGAYQAGTIGFVGDGATPSKYKIGLKAILENFGLGIPIFKPRFDMELIKERIAAAKEIGALAVGIDIDAASFITMEMKGQATSTKTFEQIKELVEFAEIPLILKGILSPKDAELALKAGVKALIVSNHGGRVNESLITPIDGLKIIRKAIGNDATLILDGGIRSGSDVLKAIGHGADMVMIGRPVMIYAVGGGVQAVRQYFNKIASELKRSMTFVGVKNLKELKGKTEIFYINEYL